MSDTLSIPSILIVGALLFFGVRYFFFAPGSQSSPPSSRGGPAARRVDISKVDQVAHMFPQLDRRAIAWDLSRNGGNVGATTERVLEGRGLEDPPPSFRPLNLNPASASASTTSSSTGTTAAQALKQQDLISRYNLSSKLNADEDEHEDEEGKEKGQEKGWAATKAERAALFAKRREEMILGARRKMEAQQRRQEKGKDKEVL